MLLIALPVALLLQLAGVWLGGLRELLGTETVSGGELLAVLAAVVVGYLATRVVVAIRATAQRSPASDLRP
jgi:hypothetical protein